MLRCGLCWCSRHKTCFGYGKLRRWLKALAAEHTRCHSCVAGNWRHVVLFTRKLKSRYHGHCIIVLYHLYHMKNVIELCILCRTDWHVDTGLWQGNFFLQLETEYVASGNTTNRECTVPMTALTVYTQIPAGCLDLAKSLKISFSVTAILAYLLVLMKIILYADSDRSLVWSAKLM